MPTGLTAQYASGNVLHVPPDEAVTLKDWPAAYDSVLIQGTLEVILIPDQAFRAQKLTVRGGTVRFSAAGCTRERPGRIVTGNDAPWRITDGGSIVVDGTEGNITWDGRLRVKADAKDLQIAGVRWRGEGNAPLLTVHGGRGTVSGCSFTGERSLVVLDGVSDLAFTDNAMTAAGPALEISPAGTGEDNRISANRITATVSAGEAAITVGNPLQTVRDNRITVHGAGDAVRIVPHAAYDRHEWDNTGERMVFNGNTLVANDAVAGRGLVVGPLRLRQPVILTNNTINGFRLGATLNEGATTTSHGDTYLTLRDWTLADNHTGLELGEATLQRVTIGANGELGVTALRYNRPAGVRPRTSGVSITGYATGIEVAAPLKAGNYLDGLTTNSVTKLLDLPAEEKVGLYFPNGLPETEKQHHSTNPSHCAPAMKQAVTGGHKGHDDHGGHAHHNHAAPPSKARLILPPNHPAITPDCEAHGEWRSCPEQALGQLVVTTGFGQSDPVHEHGRVLGDLLLQNVLLGDNQPACFPGSGQQTELLLGTGVHYRLELPGLADIYDLSLSWTSSGDEPLELQIPYPHDAPWLFRALGGELIRYPGAEELKGSQESAWAYDAGNKTIHLRLFADGGEQEIILYNRTVETELSYEGKPIGISIANAAAGGTTYSFNLPPGTPYELTVTDVYGSPRQQFTGAAPTTGRVRQTFVPHGEDVPGWYFLTVDGETFKGPYVPHFSSAVKTTSTSHHQHH